jgi:hypothetical protein
LADNELPIDNKVESSEVDSSVVQPVFKVRFIMKVIAFCCAVISLSWFFEGWREIHRVVNFATVGILVVGTVGTLMLLGLMTFWTYCEEKQKGTLVRRLALFETLYEIVMKRHAAKTQGGVR